MKPVLVDCTEKVHGLLHYLTYTAGYQCSNDNYKIQTKKKRNLRGLGGSVVKSTARTENLGSVLSITWQFQSQAI